MPITEHYNKTIIVKGSPSYVYELCQDFSNLPNFLSYVQEIKQLEDDISQWTLVNIGAKSLTWKARVTRTDRNQRIAWNTVEGDIKTSGQAVFSQLPKDETQVSITMNYVFPDNTPEHIRETILETIDRAITEELNNLKKYAEGMEERLSRKP